MTTAFVMRLSGLRRETRLRGVKLNRKERIDIEAVSEELCMNLSLSLPTSLSENLASLTLDRLDDKIVRATRR